MTYIPETFTITKSEAMHLHSTLEEAMMFYEMYTSKPSDIEDNEMGWRVWDCRQAQDIVRNLESQDSEIPQKVSIGDTDYFD